MSTSSQTRELARLIAAAQSVVAFTGAGISTECGIPDFRSQDSAWHRNPPMPLDAFLASEENRVSAWTRKFAMDDRHGDAKPGRGHRALAALAASGKLTAIVTQNIDGLHEASGVPREKIVELHGNARYAACLACGVRHELHRIRPKFEESGKAPLCLCGGVVKTATISFGQAMPQDAMRRAHKAPLDCDLFLANGSTLVVYPAAAFPAIAHENGARLVIINRDPTPLDTIADLTIRDDIGAILAPFISGAD